MIYGVAVVVVAAAAVVCCKLPTAKYWGCDLTIGAD